MNDAPINKFEASDTHRHPVKMNTEQSPQNLPTTKVKLGTSNAK